MVYTANIPQSTDLISNSQSQILGNFQFMGSTATRSAVTVGTSTGGYYILPNGLVIQYFKALPIAANGVVVNISLLTPLTTVISIQAIPISGNTTTRSIWLDSAAPTTTTFGVRTSTTLTSGAYFTVIGIP